MDRVARVSGEMTIENVGIIATVLDCWRCIVSSVTGKKFWWYDAGDVEGCGPLSALGLGGSERLGWNLADSHLVHSLGFSSVLSYSDALRCAL